MASGGRSGSLAAPALVKSFTGFQKSLEKLSMDILSVWDPGAARSALTDRVRRSWAYGSGTCWAVQ